MKAPCIPHVVLGLSWFAYLGYLAFSAAQLPARVATHFNLAGQPNGWMTRPQCIAFSAAFGLGLPLLIVGLFFAMRFFPNGAFNFPRREYWLAPERRAATVDYLFHQSLWLASITIGLAAGIDYLILRANRQGAAMAQLSMPAAMALLVCLLISVGLWLFWLLRRFR